MDDLRAQLAPGWSAVNVVLAVVLFLLAWPLGLLMIAYIVWGARLGLDLSAPETLGAFGARVRRSWRAGVDSWKHDSTSTRVADRPSGQPSGASSHGGSPAADSTVADSTVADRASRSERDALERERRAFEAERNEWRARNTGASDDSTVSARRSGETLDS